MIAPQLIDVIEHGGRTGVVLERLGGTDMLTLLQRQPLRVLGYAHTLAATHLSLHGLTAPGEVPDLREVLAGRIDDAGLPMPLRGLALGVLDRLPAGNQLCRGDYHPGNVLITGDAASVIDWAAAADGGIGG